MAVGTLYSDIGAFKLVLATHATKYEFQYNIEKSDPTRHREAIGTPVGLTFSTDCGQAVINGVSEVFPQAEHRECMYHLVQNFKKRYGG